MPLRVLNDDTVAGGEGFGSHPHDNMEIVSIPCRASCATKTAWATAKCWRPGEIQVMSAGTGIVHSEFNNLPDREVKFLQIWIFPDRDDLTPRYERSASQRPNPDRLRPDRSHRKEKAASTWGGFTRRHGSRRSI